MSPPPVTRASSPASVRNRGVDPIGGETAELRSARQARRPTLRGTATLEAFDPVLSWPRGVGPIGGEAAEPRSARQARRPTLLEFPNSDNHSVFLSGRRHEIHRDIRIVRKRVAQHVQHSLAHGTIGIVAQLESEGAVRRILQDHDHFDIDLIVRRSELGADCCEMAALLLERGADPNRSGASWSTPLAWARKKGHAEIEADLMRAGAR